MGKITVELIRKRAEHNEGEIQSLEELSLHQEKLEKIELLDRVCRKLKILLLQNNAISVIENLSRLKDLEYLNLALNMVEKISNLEGCESLKKLDLTLNFIGEISSVKQLRPNYYLEQLYLVGNPCHEFPGYREYILAVLPQLKQLDGVDVTKSERIQARQNFDEVEEMIMMHEEAYLKEREKSKALKGSTRAGGDETETDTDFFEKPDDNEEEVNFWAKVSDNTPEARRDMCRQLEKQDLQKSQKSSVQNVPKAPKKFETSDGRQLNANEPKLSFSLHDDMERNQIVLDLAVPRFMCTTLIDADVQPTYVRVNIKGKVFQLVLPEEVKPDLSYAQRSQVTGHLMVTMPKIHEHSSLIWRGQKSEMIDLTTDKNKSKELSSSSDPRDDKPTKARKSASILKNSGTDRGPYQEAPSSKRSGSTSVKSKSKPRDFFHGNSWNDLDDVPPLM